MQDPFSRRFRRSVIKHLRRLTRSLNVQTTCSEIGMLVNTVSDPTEKKAFAAEMQMFSKLLNRYTAGANQKLEWGRITSPATDQIVPYDKLIVPRDEVGLLKQLAVLKVNGGLGTSMGKFMGRMQGAKSALEVKPGLTILDLAIQQVADVKASHGVDVPLLLMTSFTTHEDTLRITQKYDSKQIRITPFRQSKYPRIMKDSLLPCAADWQDEKAAWYPPGHGDMYTALYRSGILNRLLKEGKKYLFVSNSDNLGAIADCKILQHMIDTKAEFLMEVTEKTKADTQVEALISYDGSIRLLQIAQVPADHVEEFASVRNFKAFNTNNLWINLRALKKIMDKGGMELEIIANPKTTDDGRAVIQLETAAGAAIRHFSNARGVSVPRSRFLPVQTCSDLLLIKSDLYALEDSRLVLSEDRLFGLPPVIKLDDHFRKIHDFQARFKTIPKIIDLDHLTVSGNVHFGRNITLRGTVIIVANDGQRIDIPDGCILENRLVSGNITMTVFCFYSDLLAGTQQGPKEL
ncbi:hypothetical protein H0H92_009944 [Tricholoma furcatifolium]|nr:hypothetical protein H0H92_009944 [Tricholoma furcatifolium]